MSRLSEDRLQKAAEWHVILHSDEASEQERADFQRWCASLDNARAYHEIEKVWGIFDVVSDPAGSRVVKTILDEQGRVRSRRIRQATVTTMSLFLVGLIGIDQWISRPGFTLRSLLSPSYLFADHRTGIGQMTSMTLSDGSLVTLGTFSAVNITLTDDKRLIELLQGEVDVKVAGDPQRPFTVSFEGTDVTALGTRYSLHDLGHSLEVNVTESNVKVCHKTSSQQCTGVAAGQSVRVFEGKTGPVTARDTSMYIDWSRSTLVVTDQPLPAVLDELQRYYPGKLIYNESQLSGLRVSGVYRMGSVGETLSLLGHSLPIDTDDSVPYLIRVNIRK
ncbi:FecR domain-containing protein [uncultured Thalassolituus sp.]|uniref:FecR family protein n=1 Tax=uncultured Thalassolituus sp. TaxID=285273 RepID=UPI00261608FB|nr:FecR domain-containing protein [uncultured Thalassolituus sp.]